MFERKSTVLELENLILRTDTIIISVILGVIETGRAHQYLQTPFLPGLTAKLYFLASLSLDVAM